MKKYLVVLTFILNANIFISQNITSYNSSAGQINTLETRDTEIKGTRYSEEKHKMGHTNAPENDVLFRFDAFSNEVEIQLEGKPTILWLKKVGNKISFQNKSYKVFRDENEELIFYLTDNDCKENCLLIKETISLSKAVPAKSGYEKYKPAKYSSVKESYFISFDGKNSVEIPKKKKLFYEFFGDQQNSIKKFMKKNKLGRKKKMIY